MHRPFLLMALLLCLLARQAVAEGFRAGFARVDITPEEPVRLSGYAARTSPMEGVDAPIYVRAIAMQHGDGAPHVLLSVESIGVPGVLSKAVFEAIGDSVQGDRARFVMASTHSHTAPHLASNLSNLFFDEIPAEQKAATERYTEMVKARSIQAAREAIANLAPARLTVAEGEVGFAKNRRKIQSGKYLGFGEVAGGPVDHSVPVIRVSDPQTGKTRGLVFNYACHCTTFGPTHNRLNGDWAGFAMSNLEEAEPGIVALCTIGCGADANPSREGPMQMELSRQQARALSDEVAEVAKGGREIQSAPTATFGYAGLPIDRPTLPELEAKLKDANGAIRRHAETMIATQQRMGRLPETYPMPLQVWRFGDEFTMVFLGGEVVVDYALRIKQELGAPGKFQRADFKPPETPLPPTKGPVWVTAYANDVFGYVASERVRSEGGYEVDTSMIYYLQPGRWSTGTEEVVMRRLHELLRNSTSDRALTVDEALKSFTVADGFQVSVVASEPLISDPVNMAVGPDGRLWVVQMGDYPRGVDENGAPGGKVIVLTDRDQDGRYDESQVFLEGLSYPTGVFPWRDGAFVSAAPEIFLARDRDGDGRAESREVYFSGFKLANPQHRVNGFCYGLDGWLYVASGDYSEKVVCHKTGATIDMSGRDMRFHPDTGRMETVSGRTQFGRTRNDFNEWFGNNNSISLYHYPLDDQDLLRNPFVPSPPPLVYLDKVAAEVIPTSRTVDRFNDLDRANRVTSACGAAIMRDARLGPDLDGAALFCEPVHNAVCRLMLQPDGLSFRGSRSAADQKSEFFCSHDNWFRPVRVMNAPDGSLWVADMYRHVIEHPQWIPEAWQAQLDVRAGADKGRIYRVSPKGHRVSGNGDLTQLSTEALVGILGEPNGARRDLSQQVLVERNDLSALAALDRLIGSPPSAASRIQALATRKLLAPEEIAPLAVALGDADPRVRRVAVDLAGRNEPKDVAIRDRLIALSADPDLRVRVQLAMVLGDWKSRTSAKALASLAIRDLDDRWMQAAVLSSSRGQGLAILEALLATAAEKVSTTTLPTLLTATILGDEGKQGAGQVLRLVSQGSSTAEDWQLQVLAGCLTGMARQKLTLDELKRSSDPELQRGVAGAESLIDAARRMAADPTVPVSRRQLAISLLGRQSAARKEDLAILVSLLSAQEPMAVQQNAIQAIAATGSQDVPKQLMARWKTQEPAIRGEILNVLVSRPAWAAALVDALETGQVVPAELNSSILGRLLQSKDREIRDRMAKISKPTATRQAVLREYASVAGLKGDATAGAAVFTKTCAACHRLHEVGNDIGAKLASLTNKSTEQLVVSILDPNLAVEGPYISYAAALKDGRTTAGMIVEQTATSITIARADGQRETILRIELEELSSTGKSFMPEGLEKELSPQDVANVVAFIQAKDVPGK